MKSHFLRFTLLASLLLSTSFVFAQNYKDGKYGEKKAENLYEFKMNYDVKQLDLNHNFGKKAKNVILLIGDGMGVNHIYALNALNGSTYTMQMPNAAFSITSNASKKTTDSAAGGTAIATGEKTDNGKIALSVDNKAIKTIAEYAHDAGKSTGVVATSSVTHATPASFVAHNVKRSNYEEIALDMANSDIDVMIGGGQNNFADRKDGQDLTKVLAKKGFSLVYGVDDLAKVKKGKLAGFVYSDHPPKYDERGDMLEKSTEKALDLLSQNKKGFFLMVEGSQIDWGAHDNNMDYQLGETVDFDKVVGKVLEWAAKDKNTLVIVTADHETGAFTLLDQPEKGKAQFAYSSGNHSDSPVGIYAYGPGAQYFKGVMENTEIFHIMMKVLGIKY